MRQPQPTTEDLDIWIAVADLTSCTNTLVFGMHDVRYALRAMRRAPGFTAVTIPSLSPGIGANPAIFSLTNTLMLQPLPVRSPGELVQFLSQYPDAAEPPSNSYAWKYYERFRDEPTRSPN